jgi:pyridoxamine 5'-phosphate oxidase
MASTPWRPSLDLALHRNRELPQVRFVQLATLREDLRPANRTVVFRGLLDPGDRLTFTTDGRSRKAAEVERYPWGEACWYFAKTREQFRIAGRLTLVRADHIDTALADARERAWRDLSDAARVSFTWPTPGAPRAAWTPFPRMPPDSANPLPDFCLLVLEPREVDHLELNGAPQNRWRFLREEGGRWAIREINP